MNKIFDDFIEERKLDSLPIIKVSGYNFAIELALKGVGITLAPIYLVEEYLNNGILEEVFKDYLLPSVNFGYYFNKTTITDLTKRFLDFVN